MSDDVTSLGQNRSGSGQSAYLSQKFSAALPYAQYLLTGSDEQQRRWSQVCELAKLTEVQSQLVAGFSAK